MVITSLFTTESKKDNPVLVVDKEGIIGIALVEKIKTESVTVFVSSTKPEQAENIIHVPFGKKFPRIPDNIYSYIIIIDQKRELDQKTIGSLIKKSRKDKSLVFIALNKDYITERFFAENILPYENIKLGIIGDIFVTDEVLKNGSGVNSILLSIKNSGSIAIPGNGVSENWPVFLDDVINSITEVCFSDIKEKIIYIMQKTPITFLSLALMFKKVFPEVKLDFIKEEKNIKKHKLLLQGKYILGDKYDVQERIKKINIEKIEGYEKEKKITSNKARSSVFLTCIFFLSMLVMPVIVTLSFFNLGNVLLNYSMENLDNKSPASVQLLASSAEKSFFVANTSIEILKQELKIFEAEQIIGKLDKTLKYNFVLSQANNNFIIFLNKFSNITMGRSTNPTNDFVNAIFSLQIATYDYNSLSEANVKNLPKAITDANNFMLNTVNFWNDALGFKNTKTYLLLKEEGLKNSSPSGSIKEYATLKTYNGKIKVGNFIKPSTLSANLTTINTGIKANGAIFVDNTFLSQFVKYFNNQDLTSTKFLNFLETSLKEKHLLLVFDNQALNQTIQFNIK